MNIQVKQRILSNSNVQIHKISFNNTAKYAISFSNVFVEQLKTKGE